MTIVRLCRSRYSPKDATGAERYGGRWNSPGHAVLYASATLALACLEVLVHIRNVGLIPADYVYCEIEVPEALIGPWDLTGETALAKIESPVLSREFGDRWAALTERKASLAPGRTDRLLGLLHNAPASRKALMAEIKRVAPVQTVPSVIIPREMNYLISPVHPEFQQLVWRDPRPFHFDPRLIGATAE